MLWRLHPLNELKELYMNKCNNYVNKVQKLEKKFFLINSKVDYDIRVHAYEWF